MPSPTGYMDLHIRRLARGDEEPLSLFYASLSERSAFFFGPYSDTSPSGLQSIVERALTGVDLSLAVADPRGEIIAHIFFQDVAKDVPHLGIGLRDAYQNLGLGGVLMRYLIALGKHELDKQAIGLTVVKENQRAFHLYQRCGFKVVRDDITFREANDSYEMRYIYATPGIVDACGMMEKDHGE